MSQIKTFSYCLVFLFALFSCEQQEEYVDFEDIVKSSQNYKEGSEIEKKENDSLTKLNYPKAISRLIEILEIDSAEVSEIKVIDFLDRFENLENHKLSFNYLETQKTVKYWAFKDSIVAKNVFYNWIDHNELELYAEKRLRENSFSLIVLGNEILLLNFSFSSALKNWIEDLKTQENQVLFFLTQKEIGDCKWYDNNLNEINGKDSK